MSRSTAPATAAIIAAAGSGTRLREAGQHTDPPKALRMLGGRTLLQRSIDALAPFVDLVVVSGPAADLEALDLESPVRLIVVAGGSTRQQSVGNALAAIDESVGQVLVHDAARPLVPADVVRRVLGALRDGAATVVPAIASPDSLRQVRADGSTGPLDRSAVRLVQTPQGFTRQALADGHASAGDDRATDDATLAEAAGHRVVVVEGDPLAFKITRPADLRLAEVLLNEVLLTE